MRYFTDVIRKINSHRTAWLIAFFIGFLVISPTLISVYNIGFENWRGVYPMFIDDEGHYLARAKEAADGHMNLGNVFLSEHKDHPGVLYGLAENIVGFVSRVSGVSVPAVFAVSDFFLPAIGFLSLYFMFFAVTKNKKTALIFSAVFYAMFLYWFGRPVIPQVGFIFLALGLRLIWEIFETDTPPARLSVLLGLCIGLLVYLHLYYWTPLFVLYSLVVFFNAVRRKSFAPFKNSCVTFVTFGIVIIPYGITMSRVVSHPLYGETIQRYGMLTTHLPATYTNVAMLFFALLIVFLNGNRLKNQNPQNFIFAVSLPISGVILNWQNVITGKYLQFSSHYYLVTVLLVVATFAIVFPSVQNIFLNWRKNNFKTKLLNGASAVIAVALIVFIFYRQWGVFTRGLTVRADKTQMMELQGYRPIFDWLNNDTKPDSVILVLDENIIGYVPIYTRNNLYSFGYAGYYLMSDNELEERWVRQNIFNDHINTDFIRNSYKSIWANKFIDKYQNASVRNKILNKITRHPMPELELVPEVYIERVFNEYNEAKKENLETALKKFKIDYILLDTKTEDGARIAEEIKKETFLKPIQEFGTRVIYKVN